MQGDATLLEDAVERLLAAGCVAAEEEAQDLVSGAPDAATLDAWLRRREAGEPSAWITGTTTFCGRPRLVAAGVFVPRGQTEDLARRATALLPPGGWAIDLCTGAGVLAAHLGEADPEATVLGVDIDPVAAGCARRNAVTVVVADLDAALVAPGRADLVTAVPPYVPTDALRLLPADVQRYEPRRALDGGGDGLDLARRVVAAAGRLLRPGGWLLVELGGDQDELLAPTLAATGFVDVASWRDDDGDLCGLAARATGRGV